MEPIEDEKVQFKEIEVVELMRLTASIGAFNQQDSDLLEVSTPRKTIQALNEITVTRGN